MCLFVNFYNWSVFLPARLGVFPYFSLYVNLSFFTSVRLSVYSSIWASICVFLSVYLICWTICMHVFGCQSVSLSIFLCVCVLTIIVFPSCLGSSRISRENSSQTLLDTYFWELEKVPVLVLVFGNWMARSSRSSRQTNVVYLFAYWFSPILLSLE